MQIKTGEFIFAHRGTLTATYYDNIKDTCASAGIIYGRKVVGDLIPYDLRHTATTLIMQSGTDFETASSVTGQSRHTLWHYTHANNESINRAVSVLENFALQCFDINSDGLGLDKKEKRKTISSAL